MARYEESHTPKKRKRDGEKNLTTSPSKKELMNRSLSAITINIGKSGLNENVIDEIKRQLKDREVVKIRFSRAVSLDKKNYINSILENTNSKLVDFRGNVAVLFKKKR